MRNRQNKYVFLKKLNRKAKDSESDKVAYERNFEELMDSCVASSTFEEDSPKELIASQAYDMWCFGVLLYYICTGSQLFSMNAREDIDDESRKIANWNEAASSEALDKVGSKWPRTILKQLLSPNSMFEYIFTNGKSSSTFKFSMESV